MSGPGWWPAAEGTGHADVVGRMGPAVVFERRCRRKGGRVRDAPVVTGLGHAGLRVETGELRLLFDPWLSGSAFLGAWYPLPDNRFLRTGDVLDCDWVAVSHEHQDHLDLRLLASLPDRVRVVIPKYPSAHLRTLLHQAGVRHVVEVRAWDRLPLNDRGDWLTVIPELSPMCHDSGDPRRRRWVRRAPHERRPAVRRPAAPGRRRGRAGQLDFLGVQMSGASWHPICYDYPPEVVARVSGEKRISKFRAVTRLVRRHQAPPRRPVRRTAVLPRPRDRPAQRGHPGARHLPRPRPGHRLAAGQAARPAQPAPAARRPHRRRLRHRRARAALGDLPVRGSGRLPGRLRGSPGRRDRRRPGRVPRPDGSVGLPDLPRALRPARGTVALLPGADRVGRCGSR